MVPMLRVSSVRILRERNVEITLTTGETREIDLAPLLLGPAFEEIRANDAVFARVRVDPEFGALVWPTGADLCPDLLLHARHPA